MLFSTLLAPNCVSCFAVFAVLSVCTPFSTDRSHGPSPPSTPRFPHRSVATFLRRETPRTRVRLLWIQQTVQCSLHRGSFLLVVHPLSHWCFPWSLSSHFLGRHCVTLVFSSSLSYDLSVDISLFPLLSRSKLYCRYYVPISKPLSRSSETNQPPHPALTLFTFHYRTYTYQLMYVPYVASQQKSQSSITHQISSRGLKELSTSRRARRSQ